MVQIVNAKGERRRLKFLRNTAYEGTDYGPGLPAGDEADVDPRWAAVFQENGRATAIEGKAKAATPPARGEVQTREPAPETRDPQLPLEQKKN